MHPILFHWFGVRIHSYTAMLYLGTVCGLVASNYFANAAGLDSARVLLAMLLLLIVGLVGARLLYVFNQRDFYRRFPERLWRRSEGGAAQLGGLWLMLPVSLPLLGALDLSWLRFWDVAVVALLVGLAFAKIGCLLHGCCRGRPYRATRATVRNGAGRVKRLPSQLLESGLALVIVLLAATLWQSCTVPGTIFFLCAGAYASGRLLLQSTREAQDHVAGINLQSALCLALALLAILGWSATTSSWSH